VAVLAGAGAVVLGLAGFLAFGGKGGGEVGRRPDLGPPAQDLPKAKLTPEQEEWRAAKEEAARIAVLERRIAVARASTEGTRRLHEFLRSEGRDDLGKRAVEERLKTDPDDAWANGVLGRTDLRKEIDEISGDTDLRESPTPEWESLRKRREEKRCWVDPRDRDAVQAELAAARAARDVARDPWHRAAQAVFRDEVVGRVEFREFGPFHPKEVPPYLIVAQEPRDKFRQSTKNVLDRAGQIYTCLLENFRARMVEIGLPNPEIRDMGNPVLKCFVFNDRITYEDFHVRQGFDKNDLVLRARAYYAWAPDQWMRTYDTGAPSLSLDPDTCVAFHEGTHQLVHYFRRWYLTQEDRKKNPSAPEVALASGRIRGRCHWFNEGIAEVFGGAYRVADGKWRLFSVLTNRVAEWSIHRGHGDPDWTLREVLEMANSGQMRLLGERKLPGKSSELDSLFYAQAWTLHHFLYYGADGRYRKRYLEYLKQEMLSNSGLEVFLQCMEVGDDPDDREGFLQQLDKRWREHHKTLDDERTRGEGK